MCVCVCGFIGVDIPDIVPRVCAGGCGCGGGGGGGGGGVGVGVCVCPSPLTLPFLLCTGVLQSHSSC